MSRLNKQALYQMAVKNTHSTWNGNSAEPPAGIIEFKAAGHAPDGRLSGKITAPVIQKVDVNDGASVSMRARRQSKDGLEGYGRHEVLQKLGSGSLGLLTNAYLEQQIMYDDELHTVQQRFYGLQAV